MPPSASQFAHNHTRLSKAPGSLSACSTNCTNAQQGSYAVFVHKCSVMDWNLCMITSTLQL